VNFNGFQNMVDALGGITLDFPTQLRDQYSGLHITTTGCQPVSGATALELVRARHVYYLSSDDEWTYDGLSDFSRIQRQDVFFRAVLSKVSGELLNPIAINGFIGAAVHSMTIDDSITKGDLFRWAEEFHGATGSNLKTMTLPTTGFVTSGGADVLNEAQPYANQMIYLFNLIGAPGAPATHATTTAPTTTAPTTTTTTTATSTPQGSGSASSSSTSTTTTTIPGDVYTNTQPEPWNPSLCPS